MELILRSGLKKRRSKLRQLLVLCVAVLLSAASFVLFFADGGSSYNIGELLHHTIMQCENIFYQLGLQNLSITLD